MPGTIPAKWGHAAFSKSLFPSVLSEPELRFPNEFADLALQKKGLLRPRPKTAPNPAVRLFQAAAGRVVSSGGLGGVAELLEGPIRESQDRSAREGVGAHPEDDDGEGDSCGPTVSGPRRSLGVAIGVLFRADSDASSREWSVASSAVRDLEEFGNKIMECGPRSMNRDPFFGPRQKRNVHRSLTAGCVRRTLKSPGSASKSCPTTTENSFPGSMIQLNRVWNSRSSEMLSY